MQQQSPVAGDPGFSLGPSFRVQKDHVVKIQFHARILSPPSGAAVRRRDDSPLRPDGPATLRVDEMNGAQSLGDSRRLFVPIPPAVNGPQNGSASAHRPGVTIVNRGHVVKQLARRRLLQRPCGAAVNRALNRPRLTDRPADLIVRKRHSQENRVGRAPQRSRFPIRAAIFAHHQKDSLTPINVALAVEQPVFAQQQPATGIKEPDVIQRFIPLTFRQRLAKPFRPAVFGRKQHAIASHHPSVIAVNEKDAGEFSEPATRLRDPFGSLAWRRKTCAR